jgi:hypothetical protein
VSKPAVLSVNHCGGAVADVFFVVHGIVHSHELIPEKDKKEEGSPDTSEVDSNTDQVERRRSVRAKRDKVSDAYGF